jgi:hypothetical protein
MREGSSLNIEMKAYSPLKTKVPLVPPKPNELESAILIGILRASLAT